MEKHNFFLIIMTLLLVIDNAHALCVKVPVANLRAGPGTEFKKTWEVYNYMPFMKITQKGKWIKVRDVDGDTHWVSEILVTTEFKCAVVIKNQINVRKEPSLKAEKSILSPADKNYTYKLLEKKGDWIKVIDYEDDMGWIQKQFLWIQ